MIPCFLQVSSVVQYRWMLSLSENLFSLCQLPSELRSIDLTHFYRLIYCTRENNIHACWKVKPGSNSYEHRGQRILHYVLCSNRWVNKWIFEESNSPESIFTLGRDLKGVSSNKKLRASAWRKWNSSTFPSST